MKRHAILQRDEEPEIIRDDSGWTIRTWMACDSPQTAAGGWYWLLIISHAGVAIAAWLFGWLAGGGG